LRVALEQLYSGKAKLYRIIRAGLPDKYGLDDAGSAVRILGRVASILIDISPITSNPRFIIGRKQYTYFAEPVSKRQIVFSKDELYNLSRGIRREDVAKVGQPDDYVDMRPPGWLIQSKRIY